MDPTLPLPWLGDKQGDAGGGRRAAAGGGGVQEGGGWEETGQYKFGSWVWSYRAKTLPARTQIWLLYAWPVQLT